MQSLLSVLMVLVLSTSYGQVLCDEATDKFTGTCETRYPDGKIKQKADFIEGVEVCEETFGLDGVVYEYYDEYQGPSLDVRLIKRFSLLNSVKTEVLIVAGTGYSKEYYQDGRIRIEGHFKDSTIVSPWIGYTRKGTKVYKEMNSSSKILDHRTLRGLANSLITSLNSMISTKENELKIKEEYQRTDLLVESAVTEEIYVTEVVEFPDHMAEFPGGTEAMKMWIQKNIKYPEPDQEKGTQGKVFLSFIVMDNGAINDVKVLRGLSYTIDAEAKRLVYSMPRWIPGKQREKNIVTKVTIPVEFKL